MSVVRTEARHEQAEGLDTLEPAAVLRVLASGQQAAARAVDAAIPQIAMAARLAADALSAGGRLIYVGAGSSGVMALADAVELPGTYGIPVDRVVVLLAGGADSLSNLAGGVEDDRDLAHSDFAATRADAHDCVIAVSASGSTPYAVEIAETAKSAGIKVVAMANNAEAVLFRHADVAIHLATPPEVISGSTRMGAGTAQKIAFNMLSTLTAIHLGHVHDGHMVNLRADNEKLRGRAGRIVSDISGIDADRARALLAEAGGSVKAAVLMAAGAPDAAAAERALAEAHQNLRAALAGIKR